MKYHVSEDGTPRPCRAKSEDSCRAKGSDGETAPHGDFSSPQQAQRFAEQINSQGQSDWSTSSKSSTPPVAKKMSQHEQYIADNSEVVISGLDLGIDKEEIDPDGENIYSDEDSTLRFVQDRSAATTRSGYPAWKIYGSEADVREFLSENELSDLPYGESTTDTGDRAVLTKLK